MFENLPILLIEAEGDAAHSAMEMLQAAGVPNQVRHVRSEEEGLAYLDDPATPRPGLVLLNPGVSSTSASRFLRASKSSEALRSIPVVVFTDCDRRQLIEECYRQGAAGYVVRSGGKDETLEKIKVIMRYWQTNRLPGLN